MAFLNSERNTEQQKNKVNEKKNKKTNCLYHSVVTNHSWL